MIYALIVIYNKSCADSQTIKSIEKYGVGNISIILFDNSTKNYNNEEYAKIHKYTYYSLNDNVGLSKAYNYVISKTHAASEDYFMILDDDTELTNEYLNEVIEKTTLQNKYQFLLPIVIVDNYILSPCNFRFGAIPRVARDIKKINIGKLSAINSGMVVRADVYENIKYNEDLFLDCVDHDFMLNARKFNFKILLLKSTINQHFSRNERGSLDSDLFRFKIYLKDFFLYCKSNNILWFYCLSVLKLVVCNSLKYKTFAFLKYYLCKK